MAGVRKTDRFTRIVVLAWVVAGVILLTGAIRALLALGLFTMATPVTPGFCRVIPVPGIVDLAYDYKSRNLFVAATPAGTAGGLYALPLGGGAPVRITGTPADFHPLALSVGYDVTGVPAVLTVDRKQTGAFAVESYGVTFDGAAPRLSYDSTIQGGQVSRPGGIAAMGNGRFYLAIDPAKSDLVAWANRYLVLPRAAVLFFNGTIFHSSINGISDPSAVALSADRRHLFIASRSERRVIGFTLDPYAGTLEEVGSLSLPVRPERMTFDTAGALWVAGPARLPGLLGNNVPSQVLRVTIDANGKPISQNAVFSDDGEKVAGAIAVAKADGHLFIASKADGKLLDCAVK